MAQPLQLRKAERKQAKIRIGLFGPSGAGKTMSSLKLARGITSWDKIALIDTENGSGDLYSHLGGYNVLPIEAPYTPEKYIEAIKACEDAGMEVIIIDSISHEWSGTGGILEIADALSVAAKNSFGVWMKLTPRHNRFIETILSSPAHIICCGRSKQDYVLNQVEKNGRSITVPEKVGLKAVTREGFDYEMTIAFDIAINHYASTAKDRTGLFMGRPEFIINEDAGKEIISWNGEAKAEEAPKAPDERKAKIASLLSFLATTPLKTKEDYDNSVFALTGIVLKEEHFDEIILALEKHLELKNEVKEADGIEPSPDLVQDAVRETTAYDAAEQHTEQMGKEAASLVENELFPSSVPQEEPSGPITSFQLATLKGLVKGKLGADPDIKEEVALKFLELNIDFDGDLLKLDERRAKEFVSLLMAR